MAVIGVVHRSRARHAGAARAQRAVRRHAADPRRDDRDAAERRHGARLRVRVALLFTLWPLGRVERVSASVLFRDEVAPERTLPRAWVIVRRCSTAAALVAFALLTSEFKEHRHLLLRRAHRRVRSVLRARRGGHLGGAAAAAAAHAGAVAGARQSRRAGRPDALGRAVARRRAVAARRRGAGGCLPGARAARSGCRRSSPDYFVLDVPKEDYDAMGALIERRCPAPCSSEAPMLRGRSCASTTCRSRTIKAPPEAQWVLNGDRGLSYSDERAARLQRRRWRLVAEGLRRRAARLVRVRARRQARAQDRRQGHRQRARPQRDGDASPTCAR